MSRRAQQGIHFIITDPSSSEGRSGVIQEVRSHAGRWTWQQIRKNRPRKATHNLQDEADASSGDDENRQKKEGDISDKEDFDSGAPTVVTDPLSISNGSLLNPDRVSSYSTFALARGPPENELHRGDPGPTTVTRVFPPIWETDHLGNTDTERGQSSPQESTSPPLTQFGAGLLDPFETHISSTMRADLISINDKYSLSVLWPTLMPGKLPGSHAGIQAWFSSSISDPVLHSSMMFGSLSHRRARALGKGYGCFSSRDKREMALAQVDSITKINLAIRDPVQAISDALILCVLCLANNDSPVPPQVKESPFQAPLRSMQWLDIYGTLSPNPIHQAGLAQIIALKGGLDKIELPGLAAIISFSSILSASKSLSRPHFPLIPLQSGSQPTLQGTIRTQDPFARLDQDLLPPPPITTEMHHVLRAARAYVSLAEAFQDGAPMALDRMTLCDHRNLVQWHIMSLLPAFQLGPGVPQFYPIYEACRLALVIFGIGVIFPLPIEAAPFPQLIRMLQYEMQSYHYARAISASVEAARFHCWCVVLGGIAATETPEREWFAHELRRLVDIGVVSSWSGMRATLRSILWLDNACNASGKELWMEGMSLGNHFRA